MCVMAMFEDSLAHCLRSKVAETRAAGMSNMKAFPACRVKKALQRLKCGSLKLLLIHSSERSAPCNGRVPITGVHLGCRRRILAGIEQALV